MPKLDAGNRTQFSEAMASMVASFGAAMKILRTSIWVVVVALVAACGTGSDSSSTGTSSGSSPGNTDTIGPAISIGAPSASSTVSGTILVTASATDNVGVVGVQFKLDGNNFGAEVTGSPYAISWNTTSASNATHVLTAVARDAAGNRTTSQGVTITVANTAPAPASGRPCGLTSPAFCDTFDAPSSHRGRAGELDATRWSAGRLSPALPSANGRATDIGPATIRPCRSNLPAQVLPPSDALICDANGAIASPHLMVAVGAQNYGQNSYRIRQPFDFAGRTGKIVFDADATVENPLLGWISVEVVEDPTNVPTFVLATSNDESGAIPRNGFELQFQYNCLTPGVALRMLQLYNDYQPTTLTPAQPAPCIPTQRDHLNHFEVRVSQQSIEVWATPASADARTFPDAVLMYSTPVSLPFSRGYVSISTHNHATLKYAPTYSLSHAEMDAWVTRWDNVGFDGPVIESWREYEVADSLVSSGSAVSVGYRVADAADGPAQTLRLHNVDTANALAARLSLSAWYLIVPGFGANPPAFVLRYRFNGKAWHDRMLSEGELRAFSNNGNGQISQMLDVPLSDLVQGENTLEFVTHNVPQSYPPLVQNIDLVLQTK